MSESPARVDVRFEERYWYPEDGGVVWLAGYQVVDADSGRYLARDQADGSNPGQGYIRVAMVQDQDTTAQALHRLVEVLG